MKDIIEKMRFSQNSLKQFILEKYEISKITLNEELNKYFTQQEIGKITKDMWDKNGQFYKFVKDKVDSLSKEGINDYLDQCLDDDRCAAEMAAYIEMIIGRHNFTLEQVQKFIKDEL